MNERDQSREAESRRLIDRVGRESETSLFSHTARSARDHMSARDADQSDRVEVWGTRIGRGLAVIFAIVLVGWLFNFLTRGG